MRFIFFSLAFLLSLPFPSHAGTLRRVIEPIHFRAVAEDDPLLADRYKNTEAFYSIRPPAGWKLNPLGPSEKSLPYASHFQNPKTGDFLSLGLLQGGPSDLTIEALSRFRGDYLLSIRKSGLGRIIGSELYQFDHFDCVQIMLENKGILTLQLLVFNQPGSFLMLSFSMGAGRYHSLAREVESSIASLEWPSL